MASPHKFCGVNPVNFRDPEGTDRWVVDYLHTFIIVDVWKNGQVVSQKAITFSIRGVEIVDWFEGTEGSRVRKISSTCEEDQKLLRGAEFLQENIKWWRYHLIWFNCRHFTLLLEDAGINDPERRQKHMYLPGIPLVLPKESQ